MRSSIMNRRKRLRINSVFELQLTSLMDVMVIMLIFLLKSYASNIVDFDTSSKIQLPISSAEAPPGDGNHLIVDPDSMSFEGKKILDFSSLPEEGVPSSGYTIAHTHLADGAHRIIPLYDELVRVKEKAELVKRNAIWKDPKTGQEVRPPEFKGTLIIQADKSVQYDLLRKIMYTAGAAGFKAFKLVTVKKES